MLHLIQTLKTRNLPLYYFGWCCLVAALLCIVLILKDKTQVLGINAWIKPFKFFISSGIFAWTMAWLLTYLGEPGKVMVYNWVVIGVLAFETIYIALQASRGQLSHFSISSPVSSIMFSLMGIAISIMTLWTAYMGYFFFVKSFPELSLAYVWGIRLGILFFVIFAFQGGLMAARLSHTVGGPDGSSGLPIVNWSTRYGDLRIAHFLGMHALQLLPLTAYYLAKSVRVTLIIGIAYFLLVSLLLLQALAGKPLFNKNDMVSLKGTSV